MKAPPNILYILADDVGYGDLSCLNPDSKLRTPNLDRLAREGMHATDAHASSAVCTPSRYSILTGRYNWRSRLKENVTDGYAPPVLEPGRRTVGGFLQEQGYATGCFGKWHLGWDWQWKDVDGKEPDHSKAIENGPCDYGFDTFFGISASLDMPPYVYLRDRRVIEAPTGTTGEHPAPGFWRAGPIAPGFKHEAVMAETIDASIEWMGKQLEAKKPFFSYVALTAPHTPILPPEEWQGRSGTNAYGDFMLYMDSEIGRLLDALDAAGGTEDTLVVFTADNGCSPMANFEELAAVGHHPSYVFRGQKADIYEGGHRIPLLVRWPGRIPEGTVCEETVCLTDFAATCAEILGENLPDDLGEDSVSNLPFWGGAESAPPEYEGRLVVHHSYFGDFAVRQGEWKLLLCAGSGGWSFPAPGPDCDGLPPVQLYSLKEDIGERRNLAPEQPERVDRMIRELNGIIDSGRSTPGTPQPNVGGNWWPQQWWRTESGCPDGPVSNS